MKDYLFLLSLLVSVSLYAQDSTYYIPAFNKADDSLKFELNQLIKNHTEYSYTSSSTDVWDILKDTDKDTANPDNVILIYSGRSVNAAQEYNSGSGWNREHVWAKSRGDFGTSKGAGTDVHHLRPCDISVNSTRNNRNFDTCFTCVDVIDNGFNTGSQRDMSLWTFEPPTAVKGDVARMIFYMAVRYEGEGAEVDLELTNTLLSNTDKSPLQASVNTLLHWNRMDPVSNWERNRNNIIDSVYQHNRNPFIDHPELAEHIWGDSIGVVWMPEPTQADTSIGTSIIKVNNHHFRIFPNPTHDIVHIEGEYDQVLIYNSNGQVIFKQTNGNTSINLQEYPKGLYYLRIIANDQYSKVFTVGKS